ncbi:MAG: type II toxin-antitoxin system prevent-host-death family antitoxin [Granulosicoccaceae bacterium]
MKNISAVEFQREFGRFRSMAHREPVTITNHGRADVVLISHEQYLAYRQFERYAPTALFADEIPKDTLEQFGSIPLSPEGDQYDGETDTAE